jgi:hypothetical protein
LTHGHVWAASWNFTRLKHHFLQNEFQNPHIFQQTISLFPEQSTLGGKFLGFWILGLPLKMGTFDQNYYLLKTNWAKLA